MIHNIQNIVIAGAGVMGSSIAQLFAAFSYDVTLYDINQDALEKSRALIAVNQKASMETCDLTKEKAAEIMRHISFTCKKDCFASADFLIEAILEKMEAKHSFFREISALVPERTILTSNTSGLSLTEISEAIYLPQRFCGMHWLNPPHICPLIEVIKSEKTSPQTADIVYDIACAIKRFPVLLQKEVPGFLINRFQFAILREAMSLVENGVTTKEDIDHVFKYGLGFRYACLGPFEIADLGGLDTFYQIARYLFCDLSDAKEVHQMLADLYQNGDFGVKTKKGFYDYSNGRDKETVSKRDRDFLKLSKCLYGNADEPNFHRQ